MTMRVLIGCELSGVVRLRSRTFPGIAAAMAEQWGGPTELEHAAREARKGHHG